MTDLSATHVFYWALLLAPEGSTCLRFEAYGHFMIRHCQRQCFNIRNDLWKDSCWRRILMLCLILPKNSAEHSWRPGSPQQSMEFATQHDGADVRELFMLATLLLLWAFLWSDLFLWYHACPSLLSWMWGDRQDLKNRRLSRFKNRDSSYWAPEKTLLY